MALFYILTFTFFKYLAQMTTVFALHFVHDYIGIREANTLNGIWPLKLPFRLKYSIYQAIYCLAVFFAHYFTVQFAMSLHHEAFHQ